MAWGEQVSDLPAIATLGNRSMMLTKLSESTARTGHLVTHGQFVVCVRESKNPCRTN
jgi:hypothetical protein